MNKIKNKRGITLVALIVTIIILLILAGVSIATLTESGLFEKTRQAEQKSENAQELEDITLADYKNKINNYVLSSNRDTSMKESNLISNVDFEIIDVTNDIIKLKIILDDNEKDNGIVYFVIVNNKVVTGGTEIEYTIENLSRNTKYRIRCAVIDVDCNIKLSAEKEGTTDNNEYLYVYGNQSTDLTGGWNYSTEGNCQINLTSHDYMIGTSTVGNAVMGSIYTQNKIDLTEYSKLKVLAWGEPGGYRRMVSSGSWN